MTTPSAAVKVVVRVRPLNAYEQRDGDTPIVRAYCGDDGRQNRVIVDGQREETFEYATSLGDAAHELDVVKATNAQQLVQRVVDGRNATVLAYGQTAAGKTHTIDGLLPTIIDRIFRATHDGNFEAVEVSVSYLEIYNEQVRDLLVEPLVQTDPDRPPPQPKALNVQTSLQGGVTVVGLSERKCASVLEAKRVLKEGGERRAAAATAMNDRSSRSHAVFEVRVETRRRGDAATRRGRFMLADLAGSESAGRTNESGNARRREARTINQSLLALGQVISALSEQKKSDHVPYRDSKLTRLLQDSLGGTAATVLIACVAPTLASREETLSTLRYADRASRVAGVDRVHVAPPRAPTAEDLAALERSLDEAKRKNAFLAQGGPDSRAHLKCFCALQARLVAAADAAHAAHRAAKADSAGAGEAKHALDACHAALAKATADALRYQKDVKKARDAARHLAGELTSVSRDAAAGEAEKTLLEEGLAAAIDAARTARGEAHEERARGLGWAQRCGTDAAARERAQAEALGLQQREHVAALERMRAEGATALVAAEAAHVTLADAAEADLDRARAALAAERALLGAHTARAQQKSADRRKEAAAHARGVRSALADELAAAHAAHAAERGALQESATAELHAVQAELAATRTDAAGARASVAEVRAELGVAQDLHDLAVREAEATLAAERAAHEAAQTLALVDADAATACTLEAARAKAAADLAALESARKLAAADLARAREEASQAIAEANDRAARASDDAAAARAEAQAAAKEFEQHRLNFQAATEAAEEAVDNHAAMAQSSEEMLERTQGTVTALGEALRAATAAAEEARADAAAARAEINTHAASARAAEAELERARTTAQTESEALRAAEAAAEEARVDAARARTETETHAAAARAAEAELERSRNTLFTEFEALRAAAAAEARSDAAAAQAEIETHVAAARAAEAELERSRGAAAVHGDSLRATAAEAEQVKRAAAAAAAEAEQLKSDGEERCEELAVALVQARNDAEDARADAAGAQARLDEAAAKARDDARDYEAELARAARAGRTEVLQARREAAEATAQLSRRRSAEDEAKHGEVSRARAEAAGARDAAAGLRKALSQARADAARMADAARQEEATLTNELAAARTRLREDASQRDQDAAAALAAARSAGASSADLARARDAAVGEAERLREKIAAVVAEGAQAAALAEGADATIVELRKNLEAVVGEARARDGRARLSSARKEAEIARLAALARAAEATAADLAAWLARAEAVRGVAAPLPVAAVAAPPVEVFKAARPGSIAADDDASTDDDCDEVEVFRRSLTSDSPVVSAKLRASMEPSTPGPVVTTHDAPDDATTGTPQSCSSSPVAAADDEAETDVESEGEAYVNASRGNAKAAAPPPTPYVVPQAASSDDEGDAPEADDADAPVEVDEESEADEPAEDEAPSPDAADADAFRPLTPLARPSCVPPPSLSSPAEPDCLACATGDRRRKHTCGAAARLRNAARSKPKPAKKSVHAWRLDDDDELAEDAPAPRRSGRARTKVATYATEENDVPKRAARKRRAAANDRSPFKSGANVFGF